jgi:hypothetical protein
MRLTANAVLWICMGTGSRIIGDARLRTTGSLHFRVYMNLVLRLISNQIIRTCVEP